MFAAASARVAPVERGVTCVYAGGQMIRVRLVTSATLDEDVESHLSHVDAIPRLDLLKHPSAVPNNLALIARDACRLWGGDADVVVTAGEPALVSTVLAWRGPLIHLPLGTMSRTELRLIRWRSARSTRVVFSTHIAANHAFRAGVASEQLRVIRPSPPSLHATRQTIRDSLAIGPSTTCVLIAGRVRQQGGHHFSFWTSSVLAFRDDSWRMLIDAGRFDKYVERLARSTSRPGCTIVCDQCSSSELAAIADVALIDPEATPSFTAIASAARQRVPIVADAAMWRREQLLHVPALVQTERKPRAWARAVLDAVEGRAQFDRDALPSSVEANCDPRFIQRQWLETLHSICGRNAADSALAAT